MFRKICSLIFFKLLGWKLLGSHHPEIKKKLLVVIPHTSNWDFPIGIMVRTIINDRIKFIGKSSLFKPPFGFLFRWMGGIPVDRSKSTNFVDAVVNMFIEAETLNVVIAPEGTRSKVEKLKTGYYYIAHNARIPILMCSFDYHKKEVIFSDPFVPTGDYDKDFEILKRFFSSARGKNPELGFF